MSAQADQVAKDHTEWFDFERCIRHLKAYYTSIYILVDRVDETSFTTRNADTAFDLISAILTNLALLNPVDPAWCFKFFLWDAVQPSYIQHGRTDRVETHELRWSAEQLVAMLDERTSFYSEQRLSEFTEIFDNEGVQAGQLSFRELLVLFSHGSPRDSIRIMQRILGCHLEALNRSGTSLTSLPSKVPFQTACQGVLIFSKDRFVELIANSEARRQMEAVHQVSLTSTTFTTRIQKITTNAANSKINTWKQMGAIDQIGDIMMNRTGKPNRLYAFADPRIALCASGLSVDSFIEEKVRKCSHCGSIQIRDWNSGNQQGQCSSCQSILNGEAAWEPDEQLLRMVRRELTSALNDATFVELIVDDLGFDIEELRAEKFSTVEMMWKWAINRAVDEGPAQVSQLVNEALERTSSDKTESPQELRAVAIQADRRS